MLIDCQIASHLFFFIFGNIILRILIICVWPPGSGKWKVCNAQSDLDRRTQDIALLKPIFYNWTSDQIYRSHYLIQIWEGKSDMKHYLSNMWRKMDLKHHTLTSHCIALHCIGLVTISIEKFRPEYYWAWTLLHSNNQGRLTLGEIKDL